jgi:hypothetical protein
MKLVELPRLKDIDPFYTPKRRKRKEIFIQEENKVEEETKSYQSCEKANWRKKIVET